MSIIYGDECRGVYCYPSYTTFQEIFTSCALGWCSKTYKLWCWCSCSYMKLTIAAAHQPLIKLFYLCNIGSCSCYSVQWILMVVLLWKSSAGLPCIIFIYSILVMPSYSSPIVSKLWVSAPTNSMQRLCTASCLYELRSTDVLCLQMWYKVIGCQRQSTCHVKKDVMSR